MMLDEATPSNIDFGTDAEVESVILLVLSSRTSKSFILFHPKIFCLPTELLPNQN